MALKLRTVMTYPLDGSTVDFSITFEYLARKFVSVTLIGKDRKELVLNQDFRFTTKTQITTTHAWSQSDGYTMIEIRRYTSATDRLVDFADGSILRAYDLNIAQIQTLHVAEEARDLTADTISVNNDGNLDARGRRIVNLANAVDDRDAISFGQVKTMNQNSWQARNEALQFRNEAETFRNQAEGFKNESGTNATKTNQWRNEAEGFRGEAEQFKNTATQQATAAGNSAAAAHQSEVNAATSAAASANSATLAEQQADRAEREADKLGNWNALAGAIDRIEVDDVHFKGRVGARSLTLHNDAKGAGTQPVDQVWNQYRSQNSKQTLWEQWIQAGSKRMDYYSFTNYDPETWPEGRSNGKGRHTFYGDAKFTASGSFEGGVSIGGVLNVNGEVRTLNSALQNDGDIRGGRWGGGTLSAAIQRNRVNYQKVFSGTWVSGQAVTFTDAPISQQFLMIGINTGTGTEYVSVCAPTAGATFWVNFGNWSYRIGTSPDGWQATIHGAHDASGGTTVGPITEVYVIRTALE